jgi:hypothetical protein
VHIAESISLPLQNFEIPFAKTEQVNSLLVAEAEDASGVMADLEISEVLHVPVVEVIFCGSELKRELKVSLKIITGFNFFL